MKRRFWIAGILILLVMALNAQEYKVVKTIKIGGNSLSWDYLTVDKTLNRLFVSNGNCVHVVDLKTDKVVGKIPNLSGVHGIAFAPEFNRGFITEGQSDSITVFDLKTLKVVTKVKSFGKGPDAIVYDPWSQRVFIGDGKGFSITVLSAETAESAGMIMIPGNPEYMVVTGYGKLYVNMESVGAVAKIDTKSLKLIGIFPLGAGTNPTGLAIDVKNRRLFSGCSGTNELRVVDLELGEVIDSIPIGSRCDGVWFDEDSKDIFTSNGEGNITVIREVDQDNYRKIQTVITQHGARTITYDNASKRLFLPVATWDEKKSSYMPGSFGVLVVQKK